MIANYIFVILLLILPIQPKAYERIKGYENYVKEWEKKEKNVRIHDLSDLGPIKDLCNSQSCKFYYYEYLDESITQPNFNRTVLMVSGMHGNEYLGPHVLLYGYQLFKNAHIIYFPMANPSGFEKNQRQTYPLKVDPNRDFPIDGNTNCYKAYSTKVLDFIFRKYQIDLTFILHNGGNEIGFNWGTQTDKTQSHTQDYDIQLPIAEMMSRVGGSNLDLNIQPLKVGTMTQVIYPAPGTFDDWAYAASKNPSLITKCEKYKFLPYPSQMTNGLVFLFELGPHQNQLLGSQEAVKIAQGEKNSKDGFVSRGIRMIQAGLQVVNPWLKLAVKGKEGFLRIQGCPSAILQKLQIVQYINDTYSELIYNLMEPIQIEGSVRKQKPRPYTIKLDNLNQIQAWKLRYKTTFACSKEWLGKGSTFFATNRTYSFVGHITLTRQIRQEKTENELIDSQIEQKKIENELISLELEILQSYLTPQVRKYGLILIVVLGVLVLMSAIFAILRCICAKKIVKKQVKQQIYQEQLQTGEDLHTARGGIINQNI